MTGPSQIRGSAKPRAQTGNLRPYHALHDRSLGNPIDHIAEQRQANVKRADQFDGKDRPTVVHGHG
jgi:hypothetical protein